MEILTILSPFLVVICIVAGVGLCIVCSIVRNIHIQNNIRYQQV